MVVTLQIGKIELSGKLDHEQEMEIVMGCSYGEEESCEFIDKEYAQIIIEHLQTVFDI